MSSSTLGFTPHAAPETVRFLSQSHPESVPTDPPIQIIDVQDLPQEDSKYMKILKASHEIKLRYNLFATLSTWVLLVGFMVSLGTFRSNDQQKYSQQQSPSLATEPRVPHTVQAIPL